jgi:hypothetical protein
MIFPSLDPAVGCVSFYLQQQPQHAQRVTAARWESRDVFLKAKPFPPGSRLVYETFLFGRMTTNSMHEYLFPQRGEYRLFVRYANCPEGVNIESDPVTIVVGPPVQHWDELKEAGIVDYIEGRSHSDQQLKTRAARIRDVLGKLPTNPYMPWLAKEARGNDIAPRE